MYEHLLAARGKLSDDTYRVTGGCTEPAGDELGSPEDTADREAWYNELAEFLGDAFKWLALTYLEYTGVAAIGGGILMPFLMAADDPGTVVPALDLRVPESENHRLMIETSRYLTNADIIARLETEGYDHVDELRDDQTGVHDWLLQRLQEIAAHDFDEYNARPYTRYSLNAVLNLHDFATVHGDAKLRTAARIVLDLSASKFAATSNRGRRVVPFRRLSDSDGDDNAYLYEAVSGADHEVVRAMLLSGQTQLLDTKLDPSIGRAALAEMVNAATSDYRAPIPAIEAAIGGATFEQTVRHAGVERVFQAPAFTISAGGVRTGPSKTMGIFGGRAADQGIAMPTVVIPTLTGAYRRDLFRFDFGSHERRSPNTCVAPGFACGLAPKLSTVFDACTRRLVTSQRGHFFVSSAVCFPASRGPHFYLAARIADCSAGCWPGTQWGIVDIIAATPPPAASGPQGPQAAPDPAFERFQVERNAALEASIPDPEGNGRYLTAAGRRIEFHLGRTEDDESTIRTIDGAPPAPWVTAGAVLDADGLGRATIKGLGGPITIDYSTWSNPQRTP
jgi:hypothetical protein